MRRRLPPPPQCSSATEKTTEGCGSHAPRYRITHRNRVHARAERSGLRRQRRLPRRRCARHEAQIFVCRICRSHTPHRPWTTARRPWRGPPAGCRKCRKDFAISVYASGLSDPRWMALAPNGDVFLAEPDAGKITLLREPSKAAHLRHRFRTAARPRLPRWRALRRRPECGVEARLQERRHAGGRAHPHHQTRASAARRDTTRATSRSRRTARSTSRSAAPATSKPAIRRRAPACRRWMRTARSAPSPAGCAIRWASCSSPAPTRCG